MSKFTEDIKSFIEDVHHFLTTVKDPDLLQQKQHLLTRIHSLCSSYPSKFNMSASSSFSSVSLIHDGYIFPTEILLKSKNLGYLHKEGLGFQYHRSQDILNVLSKYDAIGYDMDHTICQYKLEALNCMLYEFHSKFLIQSKGYDPNFLAQSYASGQKFVQKGLILDKARGNVLKVSYDHQILRGYHGTKPIDLSDLKNIYGSDLKWKDLDGFPQKQVSEKSPHSYYIFYDFFVVFASLICMRIVDSLDAKHGPQDVYTFWNDVYDGLVHIFTPEGGFYKSLVNAPDRYLKKCSTGFESWLQHLSSQKKIFLLSNSPMDFVSFLCDYCLGPSWQKYFDIIITDGNKPDFFNSTSSFHKMVSGMEAGPISKEEICTNHIYSRGNWQDLLYFFNQYSETPLENILYFGDSFLSDIFSPVMYSCCKTAAIVEELEIEHAQDNQSQSPWGSFFSDTFYGKSQEPVEVVPLCFGTICNHATLIVPSLDTLTKNVA